MDMKALILRLRRAIDDRLPNDGTQPEYSDAELEAYLKEVNYNLDMVASNIWLEKASQLAPESSGFSSYSVAGESYTMADRTKAYDHAMAMYKLYRNRASSSVILPTQPAGDNNKHCHRSGDISRLTQDKALW